MTNEVDLKVKVGSQIEILHGRLAKDREENVLCSDQIARLTTTCKGTFIPESCEEIWKSDVLVHQESQALSDLLVNRKYELLCEIHLAFLGLLSIWIEACIR